MTLHFSQPKMSLQLVFKLEFEPKRKHTKSLFVYVTSHTSRYEILKMLKLTTCLSLHAAGKCVITSGRDLN